MIGRNNTRLTKFRINKLLNLYQDKGKHNFKPNHPSTDEFNDYFSRMGQINIVLQ